MRGKSESAEGSAQLNSPFTLHPSPTILIMAGGTGGHVFPGLAVAEYMRDKGWQVIWMGSKEGMEAELVPSKGFEMAWIRFSGLRGKGFIRMLLLPTNLLIAFWQSMRQLLRYKPKVVLGMGGYVSFPGGMMALLLGKPLVIHEQNSIAGLANKVLAMIADKVLVAFPKALANGFWSGNPVRKDIAGLPAPSERFKHRSGPIKLLVVGGSLGAQVLNEIVPQALKLLPQNERPQVIHQAGHKHFDTLKDNYARAEIQAELVPFIEDMAHRYSEADLVICRAGAMTIAELAAVGVASILVPFPHAVDDHQTHNAKFLSEAGAAVLIRQQELSAERLSNLLRELSRDKLLRMAERARSLAKPEATKVVAEICMSVAIR